MSRPAAHLALAVVLLLAAGAASADTGAGRLIPFSIEDQFKEAHTEAEFAGQTVAVVWFDRSGRELVPAWADSLAAAFARVLPQESWQVRLAGHTKGAPFFVKGKIRGSFPQDPERWALLDWQGVLREAYAPTEGRITVLLFGPDGVLIARRTALEVDRAAVADLARAAELRAARPRPADVPARLAAAARERLTHRVRYDGRYRKIGYPWGDVPDSVGVCSDLVVRAYRGLGIDLQREVHEDMVAHFDAYPDRWGLTGPDPNIDHRRVPNLQVFFTRRGISLPPSDRPGDYRPGDVVTWLLPGGLPHIGIVVDGRSVDGERPLIVHNIGRGPRCEDFLFTYPVTGHFRYDGSR